ncbi:ATP-dependent Clp protease ATP-binding subunit ClpC [Murinocardiopsis flavida]|uniref:ATP-dependent Clp protease ATP-binding subunit ClpC n=1 Tax=Murinocardiopsis flavida TaxID=645275 RepID=A0A2P8DMR3_9ACTN|nr:AAA family ATPase [Murinocardiopsis flavida]PSK98497.1 ATP-dependent Clp protease ATP-binding subunit ClpC [Murinocardiopsis flavida]
MDIMGIPARAVDPDLLAATDGFGAAALVAAETGAVRVEPVHLLVVLGRIKGGLAASLFASARIPVDVFAAALAARGGQSPRFGTQAAAGLDDATANRATRAVFARLRGECADGAAVLDERRVLSAVLDGLHVRDRELLARYGRVDLAAWRDAVAAVPQRPAAVFGTDGALATAAFSPGARTVLRIMAADAAGLRHTRLGAPILLHAMVVAPGGLVEQSCHFSGYDLAALRVQTQLLVGGRSGAGEQVEPVLAEDAMEESLRHVFDKAAKGAAHRRSETIAERDLLAALVDSPNGLAAAFFRDTGIDPAKLLRYADSYYAEQPPADTGVRSGGVAEELAWFRRNLVGQRSVVERLAPHIEGVKRGLARGFRFGDRPRAAFLFCGPSGAGKTLTARLLAKMVYGSEADTLVFEMGQFNTRESINYFVGAPPGYVGFGAGRLTNGLRDNPRRVFLFDEVEKADSRVLDALLRLLDEGAVNDPAGPLREAYDTMIVLTSNLGAAEFAELGRSQNEPGPDDPAAQVDELLTTMFGPEAAARADRPDGADGPGAQLRRTLRASFRPELINRLDDVVLFAALGPDELREIAEVELRRFAERTLAGLDVTVTWRADVPAHIGSLAWRSRPEQAARGVRRCVDDLVPPLLRLLDDTEETGRRTARVLLMVDGDELAVAANG